MSLDGADVVIVGAGSAGCVLARRLAERGDRTVLLLEAGPPVTVDAGTGLDDGWRLPTVPDWGYVSDAAQPEKLRRGRLVGGTSWLTRFALRGAGADFDAWAARGNPGWAWDDVLPFFRVIETDLEFGDAPWHGDAGPLPVTRYPHLQRSPIHDAAISALEASGVGVVSDHNAPDALGVGPMPMSSRGGRRVTSLDAWLPALDRPPALTIRTNALVDRIVIRSGRAIGVRLADGRTVDAGRVVISAGTYGSPLILLRSGIGPADQLEALGVPVTVDLPGVGEHLADHPAVDLDAGWNGSGVVSGPVLHSVATFRSSAWRTGPPDMMFWLTDPFGDEPAFYLDPILLKPASRGRVRLTSRDPTAAPRITLPGVTAAEDVERLADGYERALEIAGRPEIRGRAGGKAPGRPRSADARRRRVLENQYSIPHVVGTCRMGPTSLDGDVVDAEGHVHGVDRLHVVDASILPDAPAGFPHLIVLMAAERIAAQLG